MCYVCDGDKQTDIREANEQTDSTHKAVSPPTHVHKDTSINAHTHNITHLWIQTSQLGPLRSFGSVHLVGVAHQIGPQ